MEFETAPTPDPGFPVPPATVTAAQQLAKEFLDGFHQLISKLPKFESPHPTTTPFVRGHRNVPGGFAKTAANQVALAPELQALNVFDTEGLQSDIQQVEAFTPMLQEVDAFVEAAYFSLGYKQAKANVTGFRILKMSEALVTDPSLAHLSANIAAMKASKKRAKAKKPLQSQTGQATNGGVVMLEQKGGTTATANH